MVCEKCQKKLGKVVTPDPWKTGARNTTVCEFVALKRPISTHGTYRATYSQQTESGGRMVNENKALTSKKNRYNPYSTSFEKCRICKSSVHQKGSHYCQGCAYKKGICAMCGKKLLETKNYRQSSV